MTLSVVKPDALMELVVAPALSFRPAAFNTGSALTGVMGVSVTTSTDMLRLSPLESVNRKVELPTLTALTLSTVPLMTAVATAGLPLVTW